jgi:lauroyl/myristoyl acyltransferase
MVKIISCIKFVYGTNHNILATYRKILLVFCGIFEHYLEKLLLGHRNFADMKQLLQRKFSIENKDILDNAAFSGSGAIFVTGHFGAVEYLPLALSLNGYKIAFIVRFKTAELRKQLLKRAQEMDVLVIDADQPRVAFKALDAIKQGRLLITECDEFSEWRRHKSEKVSLFGNIVSRDTTLDFFYKRARVPVMLGLMKRRKGRFILSIDHLADGHEKVALSRKTWDCLERHIVKEPHQWYQWKDAAAELAPFIENRRMEKRHTLNQKIRRYQWIS